MQWLNNSARAAWRELKLRLLGPVGSVLFHILVLVVLVKFAVQPPTQNVAKTEVTVMEANATKLDEVAKEVEKEISKLDDQPREMDNTQQPSDAPNFSSDAPVDQSGSGDAGAGIGSGPASGGDVALATGFEINNAVKGNLVMKGLYSQRTAGGRTTAMARFGASRVGEDSVLRALRWLKKNQDPNGAWAKVDATDPVAMAGLALLSFLAHGETPASPEFGETVEKAMKFLVSSQAPTGMFGNNVYTHGICTYAMAEGFGLTKIMSLREAMEKGVAVIVKGQQPQGGFDYGYAKADRFDMSVAGWQFQALKAAKMAGCTNPGLHDAIKKGLDFLRKQAYDPTAGGFVYSGKPGIQSKGGSSPSMTSAGTLCLQLLGQPAAPEVRTGVEFIKDMQCKWDAQPPDQKTGRGKNPVYTWYYATQVKFQKGGADWENWNKRFARQIVFAQQKDGHWENGDWGGHVYTTALCTLMLEVYYRYLPSYQKVEDAPVDTKRAPTEEVSVNVI